ncbi:hypothetical protein [Lysinibacillus xylanilyticus]|uniref:hypothetical protein n=1 Tax=Lysinibacillus xylanilyticus TaxID=582475 RepID=UPI0038108D13
MQEIIKSFMNEPWWLISTNMSKSLTKELEKELLLKHILYEKEAIAVARRKDNDDVFFGLKS